MERPKGKEKKKEKDGNEQQSKDSTNTTAMFDHKLPALSQPGYYASLVDSVYFTPSNSNNKDDRKDGGRGGGEGDATSEAAVFLNKYGSLCRRVTRQFIASYQTSNRSRDIATQSSSVSNSTTPPWAVKPQPEHLEAAPHAPTLAAAEHAAKRNVLECDFLAAGEHLAADYCAPSSFEYNEDAQAMLATPATEFAKTQEMWERRQELVTNIAKAVIPSLPNIIPVVRTAAASTSKEQQQQQQGGEKQALQWHIVIDEGFSLTPAQYKAYLMEVKKEQQEIKAKRQQQQQQRETREDDDEASLSRNNNNSSSAVFDESQLQQLRRTSSVAASPTTPLSPSSPASASKARGAAASSTMAPLTCFYRPMDGLVVKVWLDAEAGRNFVKASSRVWQALFEYRLSCGGCFATPAVIPLSYRGMLVTVMPVVPILSDRFVRKLGGMGEEETLLSAAFNCIAEVLLCPMPTGEKEEEEEDDMIADFETSVSGARRTPHVIRAVDGKHYLFTISALASSSSSYTLRTVTTSSGGDEKEGAAPVDVCSRPLRPEAMTYLCDADNLTVPSLALAELPSSPKARQTAKKTAKGNTAEKSTYCQQFEFRKATAKFAEVAAAMKAKDSNKAAVAMPCRDLSTLDPDELRQLVATNIVPLCASYIIGDLNERVVIASGAKDAMGKMLVALGSAEKYIRHSMHLFGINLCLLHHLHATLSAQMAAAARMAASPYPKRVYQMACLLVEYEMISRAVKTMIRAELSSLQAHYFEMGKSKKRHALDTSAPNIVLEFINRAMRLAVTKDKTFWGDVVTVMRLKFSAPSNFRFTLGPELFQILIRNVQLGIGCGYDAQAQKFTRISAAQLTPCVVPVAEVVRLGVVSGGQGVVAGFVLNKELEAAEGGTSNGAEGKGSTGNDAGLRAYSSGSSTLQFLRLVRIAFLSIVVSWSSKTEAQLANLCNFVQSNKCLVLRGKQWPAPGPATSPSSPPPQQQNHLWHLLCSFSCEVYFESEQQEQPMAQQHSAALAAYLQNVEDAVKNEAARKHKQHLALRAEAMLSSDESCAASHEEMTLCLHQQTLPQPNSATTKKGSAPCVSAFEFLFLCQNRTLAAKQQASSDAMIAAVNAFQLASCRFIVLYRHNQTNQQQDQQLPQGSTSQEAATRSETKQNQPQQEGQQLELAISNTSFGSQVMEGGGGGSSSATTPVVSDEVAVSPNRKRAVSFCETDAQQVVREKNSGSNKDVALEPIYNLHSTLCGTDSDNDGDSFLLVGHLTHSLVQLLAQGGNYIGVTFLGETLIVDKKDDEEADDNTNGAKKKTTQQQLQQHQSNALQRFDKQQLDRLVSHVAYLIARYHQAAFTSFKLQSFNADSLMTLAVMAIRQTIGRTLKAISVMNQKALSSQKGNKKQSGGGLLPLDFAFVSWLYLDILCAQKECSEHFAEARGFTPLVADATAQRGSYGVALAQMTFLMFQVSGMLAPGGGDAKKTAELLAEFGGSVQQATISAAGGECVVMDDEEVDRLVTQDVAFVKRWSALADLLLNFYSLDTLQNAAWKHEGYSPFAATEEKCSGCVTASDGKSLCCASNETNPPLSAQVVSKKEFSAFIIGVLSTQFLKQHVKIIDASALECVRTHAAMCKAVERLLKWRELARCRKLLPSASLRNLSQQRNSSPSHRRANSFTYEAMSTVIEQYVRECTLYHPLSQFVVMHRWYARLWREHRSEQEEVCRGEIIAAEERERLEFIQKLFARVFAKHQIISLQKQEYLARSDILRVDYEGAFFEAAARLRLEEVVEPNAFCLIEKQFVFERAEIEKKEVERKETAARFALGFIECDCVGYEVLCREQICLAQQDTLSSELHAPFLSELHRLQVVAVEAEETRQRELHLEALDYTSEWLEPCQRAAVVELAEAAERADLWLRFTTETSGYKRLKLIAAETRERFGIEVLEVLEDFSEQIARTALSLCEMQEWNALARVAVDGEATCFGSSRCDVQRLESTAFFELFVVAEAAEREDSEFRTLMHDLYRGYLQLREQNTRLVDVEAAQLEGAEEIVRNATVCVPFYSSLWVGFDSPFSVWQRDRIVHLEEVEARRTVQAQEYCTESEDIFRQHLCATEHDRFLEMNLLFAIAEHVLALEKEEDATRGHILAEQADAAVFETFGTRVLLSLLEISHSLRQQHLLLSLYVADFLAHTMLVQQQEPAHRSHVVALWELELVGRAEVLWAELCRMQRAEVEDAEASARKLLLVFPSELVWAVELAEEASRIRAVFAVEEAEWIAIQQQRLDEIASFVARCHEQEVLQRCAIEFAQEQKERRELAESRAEAELCLLCNEGMRRHVCEVVCAQEADARCAVVLQHDIYPERAAAFASLTAYFLNILSWECEIAPRREIARLEAAQRMHLCYSQHTASEFPPLLAEAHVLGALHLSDQRFDELSCLYDQHVSAATKTRLMLLETRGEAPARAAIVAEWCESFRNRLILCREDEVEQQADQEEHVRSSCVAASFGRALNAASVRWYVQTALVDEERSARAAVASQRDRHTLYCYKLTLVSARQSLMTAECEERYGILLWMSVACTETWQRRRLAKQERDLFEQLLVLGQISAAEIKEGEERVKQQQMKRKKHGTPTPSLCVRDVVEEMQSRAGASPARRRLQEKLQHGNDATKKKEPAARVGVASPMRHKSAPISANSEIYWLKRRLLHYNWREHLASDTDDDRAVALKQRRVRDKNWNFKLAEQEQQGEQQQQGEDATTTACPTAPNQRQQHIITGTQQERSEAHGIVQREESRRWAIQLRWQRAFISMLKDADTSASDVELEAAGCDEKRGKRSEEKKTALRKKASDVRKRDDEAGGEDSGDEDEPTTAANEEASRAKSSKRKKTGATRREASGRGGVCPYCGRYFRKIKNTTKKNKNNNDNKEIEAPQTKEQNEEAEETAAVVDGGQTGGDSAHDVDTCGQRIPYFKRRLNLHFKKQERAGEREEQEEQEQGPWEDEKKVGRGIRVDTDASVDVLERYCSLQDSDALLQRALKKLAVLPPIVKHGNYHQYNSPSQHDHEPSNKPTTTAAPEYVPTKKKKNKEPTSRGKEEEVEASGSERTTNHVSASDDKPREKKETSKVAASFIEKPPWNARFFEESAKQKSDKHKAETPSPRRHHQQQHQQHQQQLEVQSQKQQRRLAPLWDGNTASVLNSPFAEPRPRVLFPLQLRGHAERERDEAKGRLSPSPAQQRRSQSPIQRRRDGDELTQQQQQQQQCGKEHHPNAAPHSSAGAAKTLLGAMAEKKEHASSERKSKKKAHREEWQVPTRATDGDQQQQQQGQLQDSSTPALVELRKQFMSVFRAKSPTRQLQQRH